MPPLPQNLGGIVEKKTWWSSKTIWVNLLSVIGIVTQSVTGVDVVSPEIQAGVLAIANVVLRMVTKSPVEW